MSARFDPPENFGDLLRDPKRLADAFRLLYLLANLQVELVVPTSADALAGNKPAIKISDANAHIPIPLKFATPWAVPTGTVSRATFATSTVTTAELAQRVAALIQDLQLTGQASSI